MYHLVCHNWNVLADWVKFNLPSLRVSSYNVELWHTVSQSLSVMMRSLKFSWNISSWQGLVSLQPVHKKNLWSVCSEAYSEMASHNYMNGFKPSYYVLADPSEKNGYLTFFVSDKNQFWTWRTTGVICTHKSQCIYGKQDIHIKISLLQSESGRTLST